MYPVNFITLLTLCTLCTLIFNVSGQGREGGVESSPSFHRVQLRFRPDGSLTGSQGSELDRFFSGTGRNGRNNRNNNNNRGFGGFPRMRRPNGYRFFSWFG